MGRCGFLAGVLAICLACLAPSAAAQSGMRSLVERQSPPPADVLNWVKRHSALSPGDGQAFVRRSVWAASAAAGLARRSVPDAAQVGRLQRDAAMSPDALRRLDARSAFSEDASRQLEAASHAPAERIARQSDPSGGAQRIGRHSVPTREEAAGIARTSSRPDANLLRSAQPSPSGLAHYLRRSVMSGPERRVFLNLSVD